VLSRPRKVRVDTFAEPGPFQFRETASHLQYRPLNTFVFLTQSHGMCTSYRRAGSGRGGLGGWASEDEIEPPTGSNRC
jgi:hypothetical protein